MSGLKETCPVVLSQKLIWGDMDAYQHINNAVYFRYFEDERIEYFSKIGIPGIIVSANENLQQNNQG